MIFCNNYLIESDRWKKHGHIQTNDDDVQLQSAQLVDKEDVKESLLAVLISFSAMFIKFLNQLFSKNKLICPLSSETSFLQRKAISSPENMKVSVESTEKMVISR